MEDTQSGFRRRGGRTQLLHPPAAALGRVAVAILLVAHGSAESPAVRAITSPSSLIRFELAHGEDGHLSYSIAMGQDAVIELSPLGIVIDGKDLGAAAVVGAISPYVVDERYPWLGVHSTAVNACRGARVSLASGAGADARTPWTLDVRACDDGAAFRYVVPGDERMRTPDEAAAFRLPPGSSVWSHDFEGHYEGVHQRRDIAAIPAREWVATPLTVKLPRGGYASVAEAALMNYSGMALQADGARGFHARLAHEEPVSYPFRLRYPADAVAHLSYAAMLSGTIASPWRVVMASRTLNGLVNADIIHNLAPPPDPQLFPQGLETPWVRPGRAVWRYLDGGENTFEGIRHFSELAGQLGFEHQVVEGLWRQWTDEQLRELVAFSAQRHVGIWLWTSSRALADPAARRAFFDRCRDLGVVGAKVDFFDHEAKDMIDLYQAILREAAEHHLLLDFHGANKPTGEARMWPNELTREGVQGLEHRTMATWARHNTTLPFTRFLAGAADYTPVIFGERRKETSWAHQIATAAVFTSPLLVYGAHPQSLLDSPAVEIIKSLPSVWDETVVLPPSEIGEIAAFARRRGDTWFVAIVNGPDARRMTVDLGFLRGAAYDALAAADDPDNAAALRMDRRRVTRSGSLAIDLRPAGGYIARLRPAAAETAR